MSFHLRLALTNIHLIRSLRYRYIHFLESHYSLSRDGKHLSSLHNIHLGRRCFIIGNGPSLLADDLSLLAHNNEITFAFNRIYHIFNQTSWRPTYYISQDDKMLRGCVDNVNMIGANIKFIPAEFKWYYNITVKNAVSFHLVNSDDPSHPLLSDNISHYIGNSNTVVLTAIQIAIFMGIKEIYLIGVDHHFHTSINNKGEILVDSTTKDYFTDEYNRDKENLYIPNLDASTQNYIAVKKFAEDRNVAIYNATRGGQLEVFPRKSLDLLFD